ncbi:MAG TPA: hypothetical protein VIE66_08905 [Methylocella sp.]
MIKSKSIGYFRYDKRLVEEGITFPCEVKVFPLLVKRQDKTWPEFHQRQSRWFTPETALLNIKEESLKVLVSLLVKRLKKSAT